MSESTRRLVPASYVVALLFVLGPIADSLTNVWPWQLDNEQWRFGLVGVSSNYLVSVVFGLLMAAVIAGAAEQRTMLRVVGALAGAGAAVLVLVLAAFALDTIQLRGYVREEQVPMFKIGAVKTFLKVLTASLALVVLTVGCFKAAKTLARGR